MRIKSNLGAFSVGLKALTTTTTTRLPTSTVRMTFQLTTPQVPPSPSIKAAVLSPSAPVISPYRDNASRVLPVRISDHGKRDEQIIQVATTLCPYLLEGSTASSSSSDDEVNEHISHSQKSLGCSVRPLSGGLSNELFIVSAPNDSVLVRIHPSEETAGKGIVDREVENRIMAWLSREGIAPAYYGRFLNGRVEEFYSDFEPLSYKDMADYAPKVATLMAQLHKRTVPDGVLATSNDKVGEVFTRIESWLQMASVDAREPQDENSLLDVDKLKSEFLWLKQELTTAAPTSVASESVESRAIAFCREVCFTHMDCQSLNILTNHKGQVRLIDFEYAGLNPRAADIANTFCEYCDMNNLKANYEEEYPTEDQQDEFLRVYIAKVKPTLAKSLDEQDEWEPFLAAMRGEIGRHTLISHLGWTVWSILQSRMSSIDFDYIAYAKQRMEGYNYFRSIFWEE